MKKRERGSERERNKEREGEELISLSTLFNNSGER